MNIMLKEEYLASCAFTVCGYDVGRKHTECCAGVHFLSIDHVIIAAALLWL